MQNSSIIVKIFVHHHIYSPFSALNLSQLSLRVLNTRPAIRRTSVFASWGSCGS